MNLQAIATSTVFTAVLIGSGITPANAQPTFLDPGSTYSSFADSPFDGLGFEYFFLEDFEDGFNTPGVASTSLGGTISNNDQVDSVDGDDGNLDGSGAGGGSFFSLQQTGVLTFEFDPIVLGGLPTHVGIVWTDVGFSEPDNGFGNVSFVAFDENGDPLGIIGPTPVGDGSTFGETPEDRFFGVIHDGGISEIQILMDTSEDFEVDHLQYGLIPEPAGFAVWCIATTALMGFSRRQNQA